MIYTEIIEKLKTIFEEVGEFAHEDQQYDFENYPEALEAQRIRKEFNDLHRKDYTYWDSEENMEIYGNLPDEYKIINRLYRQSIGLLWEEVDYNSFLTDREDWYSVKYFPEHNVYIKVLGYECPHREEVIFEEGWDCCEEVKPVQKTITIYERITN